MENNLANIRVSKDLKNRLKIQAAQRDISIIELTEELLKAGLKGK